MIEIKTLRKLLIRLCIDGDLSICDTYKKLTQANYCPYAQDERCNDRNLAYYEPDETVL